MELVGEAMEKQQLDFKWVAADSLYGRSGRFIEFLEHKELNFVCDVRKDHRVALRRQSGDGKRAELSWESVESLLHKHFVQQAELVKIRHSQKGLLRYKGLVLPIYRRHPDGTSQACWLILSQDNGGALK